jgi:hypothetical protein
LLELFVEELVDGAQTLSLLLKAIALTFVLVSLLICSQFQLVDLFLSLHQLFFLLGELVIGLFHPGFFKRCELGSLSVELLPRLREHFLCLLAACLEFSLLIFQVLHFGLDLIKLLLELSFLDSDGLL